MVTLLMTRNDEKGLGFSDAYQSPGRGDGPQRLAAGFEGLDYDHAPAAARTSVPLAVFVRIFGAVAVPA
jgi:hypothetical protein